MSIHVLSWVLRNSDARLGPRLVLIVLADYAGEDGHGAYPSVDTIAREARLSRRAVQSALRTLVDEGLIADVGVSRFGTRIYDVLMGGGGGATSAPRPSGEDNDPGGRSSRRQGGEAASPDPSTNPSGEPRDKDRARGEEDDAVGRLFGEWLSATGRSERTQLTPKRNAALRRRLREPATGDGSREDDLRTAIRWVGGSKWHRDNGHTELAVICSSPERVDGYLERAKAGQGAAAAASTMSQYDQAIQ